MSASKKKPPASKPAPARQTPKADARGTVRIYADVGSDAAVELQVLAARRHLTKKALFEMLILEATRSKST